MKNLIFVIMLTGSQVFGQTLPENVKAILERVQFGANNELLISGKSAKDLQEFVLKSGTELVPILLRGDNDPLQAEKLVQAAVDYLNGREYLSFSASLFEEIGMGHLKPELGSRLMSPSTDSKEGFIPINYTNPQLASALRNALPRYANNHHKVAFIEKVLSGKARDEYLRWSALQGVQPIKPIADVRATSKKQSPTTSKSGPTAPSPSLKSADPTQAVASTNQPASMSWSVLIAVIMAVIGLLWLLLKWRK